MGINSRLCQPIFVILNTKIMKFSLSLFLSVLFSIPTFAQLKKATVDAKFPLLNLP